MATSTYLSITLNGNGVNAPIKVGWLNALKTHNPSICCLQDLLQIEKYIQPECEGIGKGIPHI